MTRLVSTEAKFPKTQFAVRLRQAMDEESLTLQVLAKEMDMTYEYLRRLSAGMNNPSKMSLKLFCQRFHWDWLEMDRLVVQDRFRTRNGEQGGIAQEFNPEVEPFERGWHLLDEPQKEILLAQFNLFLIQNRRDVRGGLK